jgi:type IV pilus assembly protein PilN
MRVTLNLASRPYVELRPVYQRLRVIIAALAVLALIFWYVGRTEYRRAQAVKAQVDSVQNSIDQVRQEQQRHEAEMREPKNAAVLDQAQFLNDLFQHKAFSWTAVMMDLERVLPAGVQVLNIDPVVAKDGHVAVRLRVLGAHDRAVDLVRNLEKSRRFLSPTLMAETADTSSTGNNNFQNAAAVSNRSNFDIVADYNPLPIKALAEPKTAADDADKAAKQADAASGAAPAHRHRKAKPSIPPAGIPNRAPKHGLPPSGAAR